MKRMIVTDSIRHGEALFAEGKIEEAENCFLNLLDKDPGQARILNNLGVINYSKGDVEQAEGYLLKALSASEDYTDALLNLLELYQSEERWQDAAVRLEDYISPDDRNPELLNRLGVFYLEMGDTEKAGVVLKKSLEVNPSQEIVRESVAKIESEKFQIKSLVIDDDTAAERRPQRPAPSRSHAAPDDSMRLLDVQRQIGRVLHLLAPNTANETSARQRMRSALESKILPELGKLHSELERISPDFKATRSREGPDIKVDYGDVIVTASALQGLKGLLYLILAKEYYGDGDGYRARMIRARACLTAAATLYRRWLDQVQDTVASLQYFDRYAADTERKDNKPFKVLVTDAAYKHTLGIVRDLSGRGIAVDVIGSSPWSQAFFSKHCRKRFVGPSYEDEADFIRFLEQLLQEQNYDLLIPVGFKSFDVISKHKDLLGRLVPLVIEDHCKIATCMNKKEVHQLAVEIGIPAPNTHFPADIEDIGDLSQRISYPVVIKGLFEVGGNIVDYADHPDELVGKYRKIAERFGFQGDSLPMIQEYIPGRGFGYYGLYDKGECKGSFMHKRIRMYPVKGGASVCAESFYDSELKDLGQRVLSHLQWHGVAMVEFRKDERDNQYKLLEINPKFWGSLDLSLQAGISFPHALVKMAQGHDLDYSEAYQRNMRLHWPLDGDLDHVLDRFEAAVAFLADLGNPAVRKNIRMDDCGPVWAQLGSVIDRLLARCNLDELKGIFHLHSKHSFDSILEPSEIVRYAEKYGYDIVSITDHDTVKGSVEAAGYAKDGYPIIIIGAEYATDKGDIIGLFLKEEITSRNFFEVVSSIKAQGGLVVLPHPFKNHRLEDKDIEAVDLIEVFNPRVPPELNAKAKRLCEKFEKQMFVGSDAHFMEELNLTGTTIQSNGSWNLKELLLSGERRFSVNQGKQIYEILSQAIKQVKSQKQGLQR